MPRNQPKIEVNHPPLSPSQFPQDLSVPLLLSGSIKPMETFVELCTKDEKSELEQTLIQCIATLSTHPAYNRLTPQDIFEMMRGVAQRVKW